MNTPVLEVTNLSKNFGGLRALNEVDLTPKTTTNMII